MDEVSLLHPALSLRDVTARPAGDRVTVTIEIGAAVDEIERLSRDDHPDCRAADWARNRSWSIARLRR
jgi:hypothetical protein